MPKLQVRNGDVIIVPGTGGLDMVNGVSGGALPFGGTATVLTSNDTLSTGGIYQLSSSTAPVTASLPSPATNLGVRYHIITTSAHAHNVTASNVPAGDTNGISNINGVSTPDFDGYALLKFEAAEGLSFIVESNGTTWQAIALTSGSHTITQD